MKKRKGAAFFSGILLPALAGVVVLCFLAGVSNVARGRGEEDRRQLEETLRRTAVACYAAEGIYPPDVAYMEAHYGIRIDRERYTVVYDIFASNLMPDITILENGT